jgi:hypothetical protein
MSAFVRRGEVGGELLLQIKNVQIKLLRNGVKQAQIQKTGGGEGGVKLINSRGPVPTYRVNEAQRGGGGRQGGRDERFPGIDQ